MALAHAYSAAGKKAEAEKILRDLERESTGAQVRRLGFMAGLISVPDDFDRMGKKEIERIFGGGA